MKAKRALTAAAVFIAGVLLNLAGRQLAVNLRLPLWLDSIGTSLAACVLGPVGGALCGAANNIIYGAGNPLELAYAATSVVIGVIIGVCMRRGMFSRMFTAMTASVLVAFASAAVSTPLNLIFWQGESGNLWGDALFDMLTSYGMPMGIASALGQLFVDFPDKVVVVLIAYMLLRTPLLKRLTAQNDGEAKAPAHVPTTLAALLVIPLAALAMTQTGYAAEADFAYTQTVYNSTNGLAVGEANTIVETSEGYIWVGTYAGLYRYDGNSFTAMSFDSVKNVNCLYVDSYGRLWIGTNDKGLSVYENGEIIAVLDKNSGLPSNSIRCIAEDGAGGYYVGTAASLCRLAEADTGFSVSRLYADVTYANNVDVDENGVAAVVTNAGVLALLTADDAEPEYFTLDKDGEYYTGSLFCDDGKLLVSTSTNEVYTWDFANSAPSENGVLGAEGYANIHSLFNDGERLWVCTDSGIGYFTDDEFHRVDTDSFNSSIDYMLKDYQGNLWFTSSRHGVLKLAQNSFADLYSRAKLASNVANSTAKWQGNLYCGTDAGLDVISLSSGAAVENELTEMLGTYRIRCIRVDSNNHLWLATSGAGLIEAAPDGTTTVYGTAQGTVGERFRSTLELSDGTVAAAENTGIDFIKDGRVVATLGVEDGLTNPQILSLLEPTGSPGTLYAGSDGDGIMVIQDYKVTDTVNEDDGLPSGVILRMVQLDEGILVVTSNSLCYMDGDGKITELKQFPYANSYDAVTDGQGRLWVLGSAGIYIVDEQTLLSGGELTCELLDSRKGLQTSLTANSWNCLDGSVLYLSCSTGVYSIDMNNYAGYNGTYKVMVDCLDTSGRGTALTEDAVTTVDMNATRLRLRPELLNYSLNDPYVSYMLEGFDETETVMQQSGITDITYTNLAAGSYTFRFSVLDNTGTNVVETHLYSIEKEPRFWEHGWFIAYVGLVCVLGVGYVTWLATVIHSNKIIEKQKQEIEMARRQAEMGNETIITIAKTVDAKDGNTSQHSARVAQYSVMLAKRLGWSDKECDNLRKVALLHDIGKIGIPDSILNKPARLTDEEYAVMKSHVDRGARILKGFTLIDNVADGVRYHHERYNGTGYPQGLKGDEIPLNARIIGIADAYDAMTSNRVYRKHLDMDTVVSELKKGRGTQFDPQLTDLVLEMLSDGSLQKAMQQPADAYEG